MNESLSIFKQSIRTINDSIQVYKFLNADAKNFDSSALLRAQYVLIVSAFDAFLHSLLIQKIEELYFSESTNVKVNCDLPFNLIVAMRGKSEYEQHELLKTFLIEKFSKDSFQSPRSVEFACKTVGIERIWQHLSELMGQPAQAIHDRLAIIVKRRNQIAHESDWDKVLCEFYEISIEDVEESKSFIEKFALAVSRLVYLVNNRAEHTD